jgi:hypothetical protein
MTEPSKQDDAARTEADPLEATRSREKGLGVGERDLKAQRDPERSFQPTDADVTGDAFDDDEAVQFGGDRRNREEIASRKVDQGRETTERQREIIRGGLDRR